MPVLAGAGGYDTREVIASALRMKRAGAAGILSVTPYYNKPTQEGLFQHYSAIAGEVGLPIVVYNVPGRTGCNVEVADARAPERRARASSPSRRRRATCRRSATSAAAVPPGFVVLSGDDALTLPVMAVGGHGIISVASNEVPAEMARMVEAAAAQRLRSRRGRFTPARSRCMQVNFIESSPGPVKCAMAAMGLLEEVFRLPMVPPRDASRATHPVGARDDGAPRGDRGAMTSALEGDVASLVAAGARRRRERAREVFARLRAALSSGEARAAEPDPSTPSGWRVNTWVKQGILLGFRHGDNADVSADHGRWPFFDKDTLPLKRLSTGKPGAHRAGRIAQCAMARTSGRGVICMPPMYINIGAYVGDGTLVDSHALVGSCAQIGARVHVSAAAQIGGVLEPVGALPVIVEDDVLIGGNCGVYEGTVVKRRAVLAAGTILTGSTPIYDLPNERIIEPVPGEPLIVPEGAVVVPGPGRSPKDRGTTWGLSVATPIIVKYRDERTDARTALEAWIR